MSNIGPHYARTLREWRRRFEARFDEVVVPGAPRLPRVLLFLCRSADWRLTRAFTFARLTALKAEYPGVMGTDDATAQAEIEVFRRKWIYY